MAYKKAQYALGFLDEAVHNAGTATRHDITADQSVTIQHEGNTVLTTTANTVNNLYLADAFTLIGGTATTVTVVST